MDREKGEKGNGLILVKLVGREEKIKVMESRKKLRGRRERIDDDLTEERKARWKVEREAAREKEGGEKVQVGYMKIWVNG